jgi:hypothetical protein
MECRFRLLSLALCAPLLWLGHFGQAEEFIESQAESETEFVRLVRDDDEQPEALETAISRYVSDGSDEELTGVTVDLIGAVHIAEPSYFERLNELFDDYDVVLYELVAPKEVTEGNRFQKGAGRRGGGEAGERETSAVDGIQFGMAAMQAGMTELLELEFQLDHIDYQRDNFVHADMSPDDFAASMEKRGENVWTMIGQAILQQSTKKSGSSDLDLLFALFDDDRALKMKRLMAEQFEDLELAMAGFDGEDGSTIITERNKVVIEALQEQIAGGKKKIAIFYGAGHFPDMERRLVEDLGLELEDQRWLMAWDLRSKADRESEEAQQEPADEDNVDERNAEEAAEDERLDPVSP